MKGSLGRPEGWWNRKRVLTTEEWEEESEEDWKMRMVAKVQERYEREEILGKMDPEEWKEWVGRAVEKELRRHGLPETGIPRMSFWKDGEGQLLWMQDWPEDEESAGLSEVVRMGRAGAGWSGPGGKGWIKVRTPGWRR